MEDSFGITFCFVNLFPSTDLCSFIAGSIDISVLYKGLFNYLVIKTEGGGSMPNDHMITHVHIFKGVQGVKGSI